MVTLVQTQNYLRTMEFLVPRKLHTICIFRGQIRIDNRFSQAETDHPRSFRERKAMKILARYILTATAATFCMSPILAQETPSPAPAPAPPFTINYFAQVDYGSVNQLIGTVDQQIKAGTKDVTILISSPGGDVTAGLLAYNYLHGMAGRINITTYNLGVVDSAANMIFCAGKYRYALPGSRFLLHSAFVTVGGGANLDVTVLNVQLQQINNMNDLQAQVVESVTNKKSLKDVQDAVHSQKILTPDEAVTWGMVNEVRQQFMVPGASVAVIKDDSKPVSPSSIPPSITIGNTITLSGMN
jgi:ATP-dependent Clp protease, protease subunit